MAIRALLDGKYKLILYFRVKKPNPGFDLDQKYPFKKYPFIKKTPSSDSHQKYPVIRLTKLVTMEAKKIFMRVLANSSKTAKFDLFPCFQTFPGVVYQGKI